MPTWLIVLGVVALVVCVFLILLLPFAIYLGGQSGMRAGVDRARGPNRDDTNGS